MRRHPQLPAHPHEEKIKKLENELLLAWMGIIDLMPGEFQSILKSYYSCESRSDTHRWSDKIAGELIERAEILPSISAYFSDRAYCPLCGGGNSSPGSEGGFSVPEGLRRHLVGFGNVHQCVVMYAAMQLARQHWDDKFKTAELIANAAKDELQANRLRTETLYRIAPGRDPELIDEGHFLDSRKTRNKTEMDWAERRLADLGFQITCEDNVKSYTRDYEGFVVYADPRINGNIDFTVFAKPLPKKIKWPNFNGGSWFHFADSLKNDIKGKYESRLAKNIPENRSKPPARR